MAKRADTAAIALRILSRNPLPRLFSNHHRPTAQQLGITAVPHESMSGMSPWLRPLIAVVLALASRLAAFQALDFQTGLGARDHLDQGKFVLGEFEGRTTIGTKWICHGPGNCFEMPAHQIESRGDSDIYVAKYDAHDNLVWCVTGGGAGRDIASSLVLQP